MLAAWGLGMAALGASVVVDRAAGVLVLRMGLVVRRVRLADVTAVLVDGAKVSVGRANGGEVSMYAWRKSQLTRCSGRRVVAGDIGHAIASAVALARAAEHPGPARTLRGRAPRAVRPPAPGPGSPPRCSAARACSPSSARWSSASTGTTPC